MRTYIHTHSYTHSCVYHKTHIHSTHTHYHMHTHTPLMHTYHTLRYTTHIPHTYPYTQIQTHKPHAHIPHTQTHHTYTPHMHTSYTKYAHMPHTYHRHTPAHMHIRDFSKWYFENRVDLTIAYGQCCYEVTLPFEPTWIIYCLSLWPKARGICLRDRLYWGLGAPSCLPKTAVIIPPCFCYV